MQVFAIGPGTTRTAMSEHSVTSEKGRRWIPWLGLIFTEKLEVSMERPGQLAVDLDSRRADALSGRYVTVFDDLDALVLGAAEIEREGLYSLCVRKVTGARTPAALTALLSTGERCREEGSALHGHLAGMSLMSPEAGFRELLCQLSVIS
ncbi:MAG TPA: hypothetical protein VKB77_10110 [Terriglobales bacterium]|nr:hypothetical protein [Terriglobales bacterium]